MLEPGGAGAMGDTGGQREPGADGCSSARGRDKESAKGAEENLKGQERLTLHARVELAMFSPLLPVSMQVLASPCTKGIASSFFRPQQQTKELSSVLRGCAAPPHLVQHRMLRIEYIVNFTECLNFCGLHVSDI